VVQHTTPTLLLTVLAEKREQREKREEGSLEVRREKAEGGAIKCSNIYIYKHIHICLSDLDRYEVCVTCVGWASMYIGNTYL
jgi:hypothetical protein